MDARERRLPAGDIDFALLEWGPEDGPLALCLHGYPDTARTWRHLGPHLAERGWHVVAPYMRGYAPTGLAPDGNYQVGALVRDAVALHGALGGDDRSVLIGHDWGAAVTYATGSVDPGLFRRLVTMAVPPGEVIWAPLRSPSRLLADRRLVLRQSRMSWYMAFQSLLPGISERALPRLIPRLWADWSPGYDASDDVPQVLEALRPPGHATAALRYYRAYFLPWMRSREYAAEQKRAMATPPVPLLYLHGAGDGCMQSELATRAAGVLADGSRVELVPDAGHFLQLEQPEDVNERIAEFLAAG